MSNSTRVVVASAAEAGDRALSAPARRRSLETSEVAERSRSRSVRKCVVIVNVNARNGRAERGLAQLRREISRRGLVVDYQFCRELNEVRWLSHRANESGASRIVAVADAFDAMTSDRPYRKGMPPWQAMEEIMKNAGKQFDGAVVEAFRRVMEKRFEKI